MDPQTLYLVLVTTLLVQTVALLLTWRQNPEQIGLRDWGLAAAGMTAGSLLITYGLFLIAHTEDGPSLLAGVLRDGGTVLACAAWVLAWFGIRHFYDRNAPHYGWIALISLAVLALLQPGADLPNWRVTVVSAIISICALLIVLELERAHRERNIITRLASAAMSLVMVSWLARAFWASSNLDIPAASHLIDVLSIFSSILMSLVFTLSLILLTNQRIHQRLHELASRDTLTGLLNRRAFFEAARPLLARLRREHSRLAVAVIDLDYFKNINDRFGHAAGDEVLKAFARVAGTSLREGDLLARYGGEEFVILLQGDELQQADQAIARLRDAWGGSPAQDDHDGTHRATFSAGIACAQGPCEVDLDHLLDAADYALYQAKADGRDCTRVIPGPVDEESRWTLVMHNGS